MERKELAKRRADLEQQYNKLQGKAYPNGPLFNFQAFVSSGAYDAALADVAKARKAEEVSAAKLAKANQAWNEAKAEAAFAALLDATAKEALASLPKPTFIATGQLVAPPPVPRTLASNEIRIGMKEKGRKVEIAVDSAGWEPANEGQTIPVGKSVRIHTGYKSSMVLELPGGKQLEIAPMTLVEFQLDGQGHLDTIVKVGEVKAQINKMPVAAGDFEVTTPTTTASVRGTIFITAYNPKTKTSRVTVIEHKVLVTPANRALRPVLVKEGQWVEVSPTAITAPATSPATLAAAAAARSRRSQTARR